MQTSYNLPGFQGPPFQRHSLAHRGHQRSASRVRPSHLALGPRFAQLASESPPELPNAPAFVKFRQRWSPGRETWRSPLALSSSDSQPQDVAQRLRFVEWTSRAHAPPSKRYTRPPPSSASASCQEFARSSLPHGAGSGRQQEAFFEEMIGRAIERRLRDKAIRSTIGERAGLGVAAGREMYMLAALGSVREGRMKAATSIPARPMSAPPTQLSFSPGDSPLQRDPASSVLFARALGHRKSSSSSTAMASARLQPVPLANPFKLGTPRGKDGTLVAVRGFIARRTGSPPAVSVDVADEAAEESAAQVAGLAPALQIVLSEFRGPQMASTMKEVDEDVEEATSPMEVDSTETTLSPAPELEPASFINISLSPPRKRKEPALTSPPLPQRPPPAARPSTQRRHSTIGIPTLSFALPVEPPPVFSHTTSTSLAHVSHPVPREVHRPARSQWATAPSPTAPPKQLRHKSSYTFSLPESVKYPGAIAPPPPASDDWLGRTAWRASMGGSLPRRVAFA